MGEREAQGALTPGQAKGRAPASLTVVIAALIGLGYLVHLRAWTFACDDAFISFRYAQNLGEHGALVYNLDPLERVEGYTNFLWVLILAAGAGLGLAPDRLAPLLTGAAGLASLALIALIGAQLRRHLAPLEHAKPERAPSSWRDLQPLDLLAPALLAAVPEFVVWGSGGLETSFALALGLAAIWAWLDARIELAAIFAALAGLTRPDALSWIACFGLGWLGVAAVRRWRTRGALELAALPWKRLAVALGIFAALIGGHALFRRLYYGQWLPNTWAVKQHGALLRERWGLGYLRFWVDRLRLPTLVPLVVLLRPRHLVLLAPCAAVVAYAWSVGGDFMAYGRFLLPATALLALLVGWLLAETHDELARRWPGRAWLAALVWAAPAALGLGYQLARVPARVAEDRDHAHLHLTYGDDGRPTPDTPGFEGVRAMDRFAAVRLAAGEELAERVPPDTWITVGAAGALPYASRLPAYDAYGLVDPGVLGAAEPLVDRRARPGHQLYAPLAYMLGREPDLMCHIGWEAALAPTSRDARRRAGPGWAWACVSTGPIPPRHLDPHADPSADDTSRYYCCLRPRDRFEDLDPERGDAP
ncbi:hypothetical protein G6O69_04110 [Pseudenhygromyxa sp. WMMC2535]|uniref:hypothetical protein n=1 Tax=Pseudenhygromyxa sp. WMMC2535 TaxID=2712867 RepID=UPI00155215F1|nr:hypothetical protein [Pseudenhygromyxa sp. WMMC2535]NVB37001.1 hypothetical protein [Pseudenhygromyxa sp. WMMC2535]